MTDSTYAAPLLQAEAITTRTLHATRSGALITPADVIAHVRKATTPRAGFAVFMSAMSCTVLPVTLAVGWAALMVAWELKIRIFLEDHIVLPVAARSERAGFHVLAAIHLAGAIAYSLYPAVVWTTGEPLGMVLATAWICGSANHLFVYFSANRLVLIACIVPLAVLSLIAPFLGGGLSLGAAVATATLAGLLLSASMFGFDHQVLLGNLAKHAAARAAAEQANAAKSQFLATMSHELRTPLNAVIGYAELIEEEAARSPVADDAAKIRNSARQLLSVIDVILDLSRLETGAIELDRERMQASAALEQLREAAPRLAAANGNTITISEIGPLGEADLDLARLYQCLLQLTSNAAKFTQNGDIRITATRRAQDGRAQLVFAVADTGIGVSAEQQAHIFEAFVQVEADAGRRFEGAGLGLTLVRRLARLMGGDVACESAPGQGSVFTLWVDAGPA